MGHNAFIIQKTFSRSIVTDILLNQMIRIMDDAVHILFVGLYMPLVEAFFIIAVSIQCL